MPVIINDISAHQGKVDWAAHRAGRQAVIIRAHNGNTPDTLFTANRAGARPMRLVGIYQYLVTDRDTAVQAREFVAVVKSLGTNEWPVLDIEEGANFGSRAAAWLAIVEPALDRRAWIYSGDNRWQTTDLAAAVGDRRRWVARYADQPPVTTYDLWQRSSKASAPGVRGNVDESIYNGTLDQLAAITTGGETDDMPYTPDQIRGFAADGVAAALVRRYDPGAATPREALVMLPQLAAQVGALRGTVAALAAGGGLTAAQVQAAAEAGAQAALAELGHALTPTDVPK